jgi:plastocyanin
MPFEVLELNPAGFPCVAWTGSERGERAVMMRRIGVVVALVASLTVAAAMPASALTARIRGSGTRWRPSSVDIARGDRVRWIGVSGQHTVTAFGGNWRFNRSLPPGASVSRRFNTRGVFRFRCRFHSSLSGGMCSGMCGRVRV